LAGALEYVAVASLDELPRGERLFIDIDGQAIVVFNVGGDFFAIGDVCTHDNGPLGEGELDGHAIVCPRHGARFDIRSGKALTLPAVTPTPSFPTRVQDVMIEIGLPV
jgi:3-phenylpropionate/trans-cinnamate dioxygenase ferredoxin subunit